MKDWRTIANASGLSIPAGDLDRIAETLRSLEETFRPLVKDLAPGVEPVTTWRFEEEGE